LQANVTSADVKIYVRNSGTASFQVSAPSSAALVEKDKVNTALHGNMQRYQGIAVWNVRKCQSQNVGVL